MDLPEQGFAILLAFLGTNILCAALIRFPWKKRQTGFVITHAGLLILLAGLVVRACRRPTRGRSACSRARRKSQLVRIDYPVIRVRKLDPQTQRADQPRVRDRRSGPATSPGARASPGRGAGSGRCSTRSPSACFDGQDDQVEVLATTPDDPFQLVVKSHLPASMPGGRARGRPRRAAPMAKIRAQFKGPRMPRRDGRLRGRGPAGSTPTGGSTASSKSRAARPQFAFLYVDRPELVEDFLNPPKDAGKDGVARFRYRDKAGKDADVRLAARRPGGQDGRRCPTAT